MVLRMTIPIGAPLTVAAEDTSDSRDLRRETIEEQIDISLP